MKSVFGALPCLKTQEDSGKSDACDDKFADLARDHPASSGSEGSLASPWKE